MEFRLQFFICLVGMFLIPITLRAQTTSPESIFQVLSSRSADLPELAKRFRLDEEEPARQCSDASEVSKKLLWDGQSQSVVAVEFYSSTCLKQFAIIFAGNSDMWTYSGTLVLEERYTKPEYNATVLFAGQMPVIVVTNNTIDSGTGVSQQNTQVFAFIGESLQLVFDEPQRVSLAVPFRPKCCPVQYSETQTSTFRLIPPKGGQPSGSIEEARHIIVNGRSVTQYRRYVWNSRWNRFYSVGFAPAP